VKETFSCIRTWDISAQDVLESKWSAQWKRELEELLERRDSWAKSSRTRRS
jgi:hypothetical protein